MSEKPEIKKITRSSKGSVVMSVGRYFPESWKYVIAKVLERTEKSVTIEFTEVDGELKKILEEDKRDA